MAKENKDTIQSVVDFINEMKPFHTKILEVEAEYVSTENISLSIVETISIEDDLGTIYLNIT